MSRLYCMAGVCAADKVYAKLAATLFFNRHMPHVI